MAYDDVGDPAGQPVVYLHGTPDSRLARHPDDDLVSEAGIRLLAIDRPGYGGTTAWQPDGGPNPFAGDVAAVSDELGIEAVTMLAWSGGALDGLRAATAPVLAGRLAGLMLVGGLVPRDAFVDPDVRTESSTRLGLLDLADQMPVGELAEAVAPLMVPSPCDHALALDHQAEQRTAADQEALERIPGAVDRLADALVEAVRTGLGGVQADIRSQVTVLGADLDRVTVPVRLWYGSNDEVTPPVFGEWYARRLPQAEVEVVPDAGHYLPFTHWPEVLRAAAELGRPPL
jgi:pimeloyl-ACP methyl ester carboxylesterase